MTLPVEIVEQVRRRAGFACEYCGVTETDSGGQLTVDHFRPQSRGGPDEVDNLLYCCYRCNLYKAGYWPVRADSPALWNPRTAPRVTHLLELAEGTLHPITPEGVFTLNRLRLNRPELVAHRMARRGQRESDSLSGNYRELMELQAQLNQQQVALLEEQRALLAESRAFVRAVLGLSRALGAEDEPGT